MEEWGVVWVGETHAAVTVGVENELPDNGIRLLQTFHGKPVQQRKLPRMELRSLIQREVAALANSPVSGNSGPAVVPPASASLDEVAEAPAVNIVNSLLNDAVGAMASDVHLGTRGAEVAIRYRIDGRLLPTGRLPVSRFAEVSARLKVLAGANPSERRRPQDGRFSAQLGNSTFDVRFSSIPTVSGESIVLRLFPQSADEFSLYDLGLCNAALFEVRSVIHRSAGFLLVSGPTGSGKTTTLHACLRQITNDERRIVTIEDPVEYHLPDVDQIQTNAAAGLTFDSILRRVLRQDPDVIMVGEIRDAETASLAVRGALTGHLVMSTVHARSAADVASRLAGLDIGRGLLKSAAPLILDQRLVRTVCRRCEGAGCERCRGTGFRGRTGIFGASTAEIELTSMIGDGLCKVIAGQTTHEEVTWATATQ